MGFITSFTPGSIRSVNDMRRALQIVFQDLFWDVVDDTGSGGDTIHLDVDNGNDEDSLALVITIKTEEEVQAQREESRRQIIGLGWSTWERVQKAGHRGGGPPARPPGPDRRRAAPREALPGP
jgi:hypothetical protein